MLMDIVIYNQQQLDQINIVSNGSLTTAGIDQLSVNRR